MTTNAKTLIYDLSFFEWLSKSSLNAPAPREYAVIKILSSNIYFYFFRPLTYRLLFAIVGYKTIVVSVIRLLFSTRPFAITGLIVLIIINSIKRVAFGRLAHIIIKLFKRVPALANFDAPATVIFIIRLVGVVATLSHINPRKIYGVSVSIILSAHKSHSMFFSHAGRIS